MFLSYIDTLDPDYRLDIDLATLNRSKLKDILYDIDVMDDFYLRLSELVLQRKITDKDRGEKIVSFRILFKPRTSLWIKLRFEL